ncbi:MAG: ferredoxin [Clostridium sp.]|uniref:ferredoxin n=1 Tax=Clostridium sp. TaxID=1506 RepID=UPI002FCA7555
MKATVNPDLCIGCGLCPSIAPTVFELGDDGLAFAMVDEVPDSAADETKEAVSSCPVEAISID